MEFEPIPETRYQMVTGARAPVLTRLRHYGGQAVSQTLAKVWKGVLKVRDFVRVWWLPLFFLGIVVAAVVGSLYRSKMEEAEKQAEAEKLEKDKAQTIERNRKRASENWKVWTKAFQGGMISVCNEVWYNEPPYRYEVICHLGIKGQPPSKKLVCSDLLCEVSHL